MPSTTTLFSSGRVRNTRPVVRPLGPPASSPVITSTMSSLCTCMVHLLTPKGPVPFSDSLSNNFRRQADNSQKTALAKLAGHGAENTRAARILLRVNEHEGIAIKTDVTAVVSPRGFLATHNDAAHHIAWFYVPARHGLLDACDNDVAQAG